MARSVSLRIWVAAAAVLLTAGAALWLIRAGRRPAHPSILLVTIDTLRADHCSAYGYGRPTTPRLDALSRRGVRFEAAYAPMATTGPSHTTMFTSLLPRAHGVLKNGQTLASGPRTLAEVLRDRGYLTAAVVSSFVVDRRFGLARGFASYDDDFTGARSSHKTAIWEGLPAPEYFDRRADETRPRAVEWLRRNGYLDRRPPAAPFFLWVHFFDPHAPYDPPAEEAGPFVSEAGTGDELAKAIAAYDGEVRFADREMGRIFDALQAAGRFDQVLTIVVGDHGEGLMQHGFMNHGLMIYEEAVRVPFVFHWPRSLKKPLVIEAPVQLVDLAPTVLDLAGLPPVPEFRGRSLGRALRGQADTDPERPVFLQRRLYDTSTVQGFPVSGEKFGLRLGRWKYIEAKAEGTYELFDLVADPGELHNVFGERHRKSAALAGVLHAWTGRPAASAKPVAPEDAERLRALGYVQ